MAWRCYFTPSTPADSLDGAALAAAGFPHTEKVCVSSENELFVGYTIRDVNVQ